MTRTLPLRRTTLQFSQIRRTLLLTFMSLSFLALPVIPALKITDHGLVDVEKFEVVPLWLEGPVE